MKGRDWENLKEMRVDLLQLHINIYRYRYTYVYMEDYISR